MKLNRSERLWGHIRTEIRSKPLRGSAVENTWTMGESLIQQGPVNDDGYHCKVISVNEDDDSS
jgi:hypothetical protein